MSRPTKKRVVSQAEYGRYVARKRTLRRIFAASVLMSILSVLWLISGLLEMSTYGQSYFTITPLFFANVMLLVFLGCTLLGYKANRVVQTLEPVERVSPDNRDRFEPDEEVLVRKSEEPLAAQQAFLLRAAQEQAETSPEQLLRASA